MKALVERVQPERMPVFGSGDLFKPGGRKSHDGHRPACSAVMFARGAMGNPFIFYRDEASFLATGRYDDDKHER
jgi:tRNA-dihydrouridine synthase B